MNQGFQGHKGPYLGSCLWACLHDWSTAPSALDQLSLLPVCTNENLAGNHSTQVYLLSIQLYSQAELGSPEFSGAPLLSSLSKEEVYSYTQW